MKDFFKVVYIAVAGLLIVLFVYPIFHEIGHSLAALCCGCPVTEVCVFPIAFTKCNVVSLNSYGKIFVGLSGMTLPFLSSIPRMKKFQLWFPVFVMRGICLLSFVLSCIGVILFWSGRLLPNEDVVQLLGMCGDSQPMICAYVLVMTVLSVVVIATDKPIKRFFAYFES